jgi:hypothetical protein
MKNRIWTSSALLTSMGFGVLLAAAIPQAADDSGREVNSISGVNSGAAGSTNEQPDEEGVEQVTMTPEPPPTTEQHANEPSRDTAQNQAVDIHGVQGTEGTEVELENAVAIITTAEGSIRSIRGIEGIDTVMLQNLEAVLRMQEPPPPPVGGGGGGRAAAALLTMENNDVESEEVVDGREELLEFELDGS